MPDQAILFIISLVMVVGSIAVATWVAVSGQIAYIDGLFLFCTCLVIALAFSLYLKFLIRTAWLAASAEERRTAPRAAERAAEQKETKPVTTPQSTVAVMRK